MMKKVFFFAASAAMVLTSCSSEDVVEVNNGNAIDFRVAMGTTSRGLETTTSNIGQFYVTAIDGTSNYFTDALFTQKNAGENFTTTPEYLWPGADQLAFYAYSYCTGTTDDAMNPFQVAALGANASIDINASAQTLSKFSPNESVGSQVDFVTAYATGTRADNEASGVELNFKHTLSQIQIKAKSDNATYKFEVNGVKIATVNSLADLNMNEGKIEWTPLKAQESDAHFAKDSYIVNLDNVIELTASVADISDNENSGFAMLIPQQLVKWDNKADAKNTQKGAYLAVSLRITTKNADAMKVYPKTEDFGWACIPVGTNWEPGKRYIYTLDFSKGAGQFPPEDPDTPGEDILGGPITCSVAVESWTKADPSEITVEMDK